MYKISEELLQACVGIVGKLPVEQVAAVWIALKNVQKDGEIIEECGNQNTVAE